MTKIVTKTGRTFYCDPADKRLNLWHREIGHGRSTVAGNTEEIEMTRQRDCLAKPTPAFGKDCGFGSGGNGREGDTLRSSVSAAANRAVFATRCVA